MLGKALKALVQQSSYASEVKPMGSKKDASKLIRKALTNAPKIEGYTIQQLAKKTGIPWPTTRWHLELLEARGVVGHCPVGRAKVYALRKKRR